MNASVPVILVSGIDPDVMQLASMVLACDVPDVVCLSHEIDPENEILTRTVSDLSGVHEREVIDIEHCCVFCAIREDVVPTLQRLGASGHYGGIVAQLPATAPAAQVCRMLDVMQPELRQVHVAAVVTAIDDATGVDDLLGPELLVELELPVRQDDTRGVGEVLCGMAEYADVVFTANQIAGELDDLLALLCRPGAQLRQGVDQLDAAALLAGVHDDDVTEDWVAEVRRCPSLNREVGEAWTLDFRSELPFHPERLREMIPVLGGGRWRSRGCFWLPSRPDQICVWDGSGGQLSVDAYEYWESWPPVTRIVVTGLGSEGRDELIRAFRDCLLSQEELADRGRYWEVGADGFEPWLGPVRRVRAS